MQTPKDESPTTGKGRRAGSNKSFGGLSQQNARYPGTESGARVSVYSGRDLLGSIFEAEDGAHRAFDAAGTPLGTFPNRSDAARAIGAVTA
jgi:hypothetical protein